MTHDAHRRCWLAFLRIHGLTEETLPHPESAERIGIEIGSLNWTLHRMGDWRSSEPNAEWNEDAFVEWCERLAGVIP